jgi:hypothetical protein
MTPKSDEQIRHEKVEQRKAAKLKKTNPRAYAAQYASIEPLTPKMIAQMVEHEETLAAVSCVGRTVAMTNLPQPTLVKRPI